MRGLPDGSPDRACIGVDAHRPSSALEPGHPLHSILQGFSESLDDVLADDGGSDEGAAAEPGPPRHPSAGRPDHVLTNEAPFTPPIPGPPDEVDDPLPLEREARSARLAPRDLFALLPPLPSPRTSVIAAVALTAIAAAVVSSGRPSAARRSGDAGSYLTAPNASAPRVEQPATRRERLRKRPGRTRHPSSAARAQRPGPPETVPEAARTSTALSFTPPLVPPPAPRRRAASEFTSEFTP